MKWLVCVFRGHDIGTSTSMGLRYLVKECGYILRNHPRTIPYYFCYTVAKSTATLAGHFGDFMPRWLLRRISLHSYHW